jgi:transcriptional regulator with XRE-family HTH domain
MTAKPDPIAEVKTEIAKKFQRAIERRFSSVAEAADDLGISRQRLHNYLRGEAIPQADLLLFAMKRWDLTLNCFGAEFSQVDAPLPVTDENQLLLFSEPPQPVVQSNRFLLARQSGMQFPFAANSPPRSE